MRESVIRRLKVSLHLLKHSVMKVTILIIAMLCFSTAWGASPRGKDDVLVDSCLVISKEKKTMKIEQGERIFVKIGEQKINGIFKYATDSTIYVDGMEIELLQIDMIAKSKTGKTVGMFFAQLPVSIVGIAVAAISSGYGGPLGVIGGVALVGVGLTGATLESYRGKRYRAARKNKRKWEYSVRRIES